jgi:hypothetical protein
MLDHPLFICAEFVVAAAIIAWAHFYVLAG